MKRERIRTGTGGLCGDHRQKGEAKQKEEAVTLVEHDCGGGQTVATRKWEWPSGQDQTKKKGASGIRANEMRNSDGGAEPLANLDPPFCVPQKDDCALANQ
jgi:hypothetical protein